MKGLILAIQASLLAPELPGKDGKTAQAMIGSSHHQGSACKPTNAAPGASLGHPLELSSKHLSSIPDSREMSAKSLILGRHSCEEPSKIWRCSMQFQYSL